MPVELIPLTTIPLVRPGDDLGVLVIEALAAADLSLVEGDVVVVTGKIVSKAEGRDVDLSTVTPSPRARRLATMTDKEPEMVELILRESSEVIRARPGNLIVRHRRGWVSAVAGIDRSNISDAEHRALLLPEDPDASAAHLRAALTAHSGIGVGVVISDSHGRPFRVGNTGVAIGSAGVESVRHLEGEPDLYGRPLSAASVVPVADLLASAAMLVGGEAAEAIPVVIVRGLPVPRAEVPASDLVRPADRDMFAVPDQDYDS